MAINGLVFNFSQKIKNNRLLSEKSTLLIEDNKVNIEPPKTYKEQLSGIILSPFQNSHNTDHYKRIEEIIIRKQKKDINEV
jgi:hypothetical protein